jgi:hypothetical protein
VANQGRSDNPVLHERTAESGGEGSENKPGGSAAPNTGDALHVTNPVEVGTFHGLDSHFLK